MKKKITELRRDELKLKKKNMCTDYVRIHNYIMIEKKKYLDIYLEFENKYIYAC